MSGRRRATSRHAAGDRRVGNVKRRRRGGELCVERPRRLIEEYRERAQQLSFLLFQLRQRRSRIGEAGALSGQIELIDQAAFDPIFSELHQILTGSHIRHSQSAPDPERRAAPDSRARLRQ